MTRAMVPPASTATPTGRRRGRPLITVPAVLAFSLVGGACGGGDDESSTSTTVPPSNITAAPLVTAAPVTAPPVSLTLPPPTAVVYVTDGASVMVANASRVDGAAGRLSDRLAVVGFQTVPAGNYALGKLDVTRIYFDATNTSSEAVANSLKAAFGGGAIQVVELPTPPPVSTADVGGAGVLIAMGNDIADKTLEELQGLVAPSTSAPESSGSGESGESTADESTSG